VEILDRVKIIHSRSDYESFIHRNFHRLDPRLIIDFMAVIDTFRFSTASTTTTRLIF
jgi:hypothetical protein